MSSTTWTPTELLSNSAHFVGKIWRMVEAQHVVSTTKLVSTYAEQELLEDILEAHKPPVPTEAKDLDYLLFSPFRYDTLSPVGSRFRSPADPGVFYAAESICAAAAEVGYWRWKFLRDTAGLQRLQPCSFTAFRVPIDTNSIDLRLPPLNLQRALWTDPVNYGATQALARVAREANLGAILYESVRDPEKHSCVAVLMPQAFASKKPDSATQTWMLTVSPEEAVWMRQGGDSFVFPTEHWNTL